MRSDAAADRLRALLADAGVNLERPASEDIARTWDVMRGFAAEVVEDAEPAEEDGDGILAQYGTYDWHDGDGPHFELDMTRQFAFSDEDGEYSHMAQLQCTFRFEPTAELKAVGADDLWSFGTPLDDFFAAARALSGFRAVEEAGLTPKDLVIEYSDV